MLMDFFKILTLKYSIPMNSSFQEVNSISSIVHDVGQELTDTELKSQLN